ncbi:Deoxyribonucleoside regulator [Hartmannibacter diazotrophicus]|uniref:Deoxyribonucleoside regulator n=1 Tax=Hartmannibacter diazotrophicus TaxID=1482074 RepID=A0A2C9D2B7_9HYPH|nr:sugar-binding transcriptional regulator [Hartmannibacter diazotrophicus]SON54394.1 Deoxyribonucleoside regulator [Hartmannibacter diazotrophicus]
MSRTHELRLMARIAQLYYGEGMKQAEISKLLHISQASVSRLITRALSEGIVRITIAAPRGTFPQTEAALRDRYGLDEVIVADCFEDREDAILAAIGAAAAHYFETTMTDGEVIGISSWSASLLRMVDAIHPLKRVKAERVVQILGGIGNPSVQSHATQLTTRLAELAGAEPMLLPSQGVASSSAARLVMLGDSYVRGTMDQFRRVTMALIGVGALQPSVMLANSGNSFTGEELNDLAARGAVGDICLRFFDIDGKPVGGPFDERIIGMSLDELKTVPRVVAVAGGERKVAALHGALQTGLINVFVTDKFTAEKLAEWPAGNGIPQ